MSGAKLILVEKKHDAKCEKKTMEIQRSAKNTTKKISSSHSALFCIGIILFIPVICAAVLSIVYLEIALRGNYLEKFFLFLKENENVIFSLFALVISLKLIIAGVRKKFLS